MKLPVPPAGARRAEEASHVAASAAEALTALVKEFKEAATAGAIAALDRDRAAVATDRAALAEPPAVYSADQLMRHVSFLAAPEREGRGFGSAGLEAAAEYIKGQFAAAGLTPAGDSGTYFQAFTATGGLDNAEHTMRNVVAMLPGSNPSFKGEAALEVRFRTPLPIPVAETKYVV